MSSEDGNKPDVNEPQARTRETAALDERLQAHIGARLRSMYDSYLNEPIPERLVELLEKLDRVSTTGDPGEREKPGR